MDFLFGYAGGQYDGETGLQYHQARYYDPATGRFLGEDPSSFAGGDANLYRYANGDPVNRTDPTGLAARQLGIMGSLLGAGVGSAPVSSYSEVGSMINLGSSFTSSLNPFSNSGSAMSLPPLETFAGTSSIVNTDFNRPRVIPNRVQGAVQTVSGIGQFAGGIVVGGATSWSGAGAIAGGAIALRGGDNVQAGVRTLWTGDLTRTALNQSVTYATGSETTGALADLVGDAGTVLAGPMAMRNAPGMATTATRSASLAPASLSSSTRIVRTPDTLLRSESITVGLEPRPIITQLDTFVHPSGAASGSSYWWSGRYATPASQPGAYQASGGAVFPTRRNSGFVGQLLRAEQEAFTTGRLLQNHPVEVVRGQAREAGLTVFDLNKRLADRGAEAAVQRGVQAYEGATPR